MAFVEGSATDVFGLLQAIHDFAVNRNWTVNRWNTTDELLLADPSGGYHNLKAASDLSTITGFVTSEPGIAAQGSTGFDTNAAWDAQPGAADGKTAIGLFYDISVPAYWLFGLDGGDYIHLVARTDSERYGHLSMGQLAKLGSWTGGGYVAGAMVNNDGDPIFATLFSNDTSRDSCWVNADIDGATDQWFAVNDSSPPGNALQGFGAFTSDVAENENGGLLQFPLFTQPAAWNGRTPLWPCYILLSRPSNRTAIAGSPIDVRVTNNRHLAPGATVVVGTDEWLVFPLAWKRDPSNQDGSRYTGIAYRKVP